MYQPTGRTWGNSPASCASLPAQAGRRPRALPFCHPRMMGMCAGGAMLVGREPLAQHPADQPENDRGRAGPCRCDYRRRGSPPAANCSGHRGRLQRRRAHPTHPPRAAHGAAGHRPLYGAHRHGGCAGTARCGAWGPAHQPAHALRAHRRRPRQGRRPSHPGQLAHRVPAEVLRFRYRPGLGLEGILPRRRRRLAGGHLDRPGQRHHPAGARRPAGGLPAR